MNDRNFNEALLREIKSNLRNAHEDNWDVGSRGAEPPPIGYPTLDVLAFPYRCVRRMGGRIWRTFLRPICVDVMRLAFPSMEYRLKVPRYRDVGYLYDRLEDAGSKELLAKLFAFRAMGHRKVRLPRNNEEHWGFMAKVDRLKCVGDPVKVRFMDLTLKPRDFRPLGYDLTAYCTPGGGSFTFLQKQYEFHRGDVHIKAEAGDVVIDAGGCWGETSLYFAHEVGDQGRVVSYEFIPSNLEILRKNLAMNPSLGERVEVVPQPLWSIPGKVLYYVDWGPGSRVSQEKMREDFDDTKCETTTIDATVEELGLEKVDFIKMDIEGAELSALKGAENSIRKYRPKLAISLYHSIDDFKTIPRYLDSLELGYRFFLDHHTIYENETVLFAISGD